MNTSIEDAKQVISMSRNVTVLTGAGCSAESGIPTYRDADGLWNNYKAEDFSSVESFQKDPKLVWSWYHDRRKAMFGAEPNAAHKAIAAIGEQKPTTILTQNIDGLHQRAGSKNVIELHGSVSMMRCTVCFKEWEDHSLNLPEIPSCPTCLCPARPAVIWFGESLKPDVWTDAFLATHCDTFIVVGTSALVNPVASLPGMARNNRARIIEVNTEQTMISDICDYLLLGKAGEILPQLVPSDTDTFNLKASEMDLGRAMQRGMEKFYAKYPDLRPKS